MNDKELEKVIEEKFVQSVPDEYNTDDAKILFKAGFMACVEMYNKEAWKEIKEEQK